eukprot:11210538-Lingulodinium_polyedra.AAC.1
MRAEPATRFPVHREVRCRHPQGPLLECRVFRGRPRSGSTPSGWAAPSCRLLAQSSRCGSP